MMALRAVPSVDCDVIVVGAGPAGAAAAAHMCRLGLSVVLLDQKRFPRDKVCGDLVGPVALAELAGLGLDRRLDYAATNVVRRAAVAVRGTMLHTSPLPRVAGLPAFGRVIPRLELDGWIVDAARAAGVSIREGWRASSIELDRDGVTVTAIKGSSSERIRARLLMGADGSNSRVAERLRGRPVDKQRRMIAVRAYYDGVEGPSDRADLYFSDRSFPGYFWIFPTGEGRANVGIGTVLRTAPPSTDHLRDLLLDRVLDPQPLNVLAVVGAVGVEDVVLVDELARGVDRRAAEARRPAVPVADPAVNAARGVEGGAERDRGSVPGGDLGGEDRDAHVAARGLGQDYERRAGERAGEQRRA